MTIERTVAPILFVLALVIAGCPEDEDPIVLPDEQGSARVALHSWSSAGVPYRLVGSFEIEGPEDHTLVSSGDEPELSIDLVIGDYTVELVSGWQLLEVRDDGTTSPADAVLTTENPLPFTIENQEETLLVFRFEVGDDAIAFGFGRGRITAEVYEDDATLEVGCGGSHTCVLFDEGLVRCWGANNAGQLGLGNTTPLDVADIARDVPLIAFESPALVVETGGLHSCAILDTGDLVCWGDNSAGQLGLGHTTPVSETLSPSELDTVDVGDAPIALALGAEHGCALLETGALRCWGDNSYGQLGYGDTESIGDDELPSDAGVVPLDGEVVEVAAGAAHTCALLETGDLACWGDNSKGQLGLGHSFRIGDDEPISDAGYVELGAPAVAIAAGARHTCAVIDTGEVLCWGHNESGQLGYGHTDNIGDDELPSAAGAVNLGGEALSLTAGASFTCALLETGAARCWGANTYGQLGYGDTTPVGVTNTPDDAGDVPVSTSITALDAGDDALCAVINNGALRCWGRNDSGQLGYGGIDHVGDDESVSTAGTVLYR